jgi:hypothetical protein
MMGAARVPASKIPACGSGFDSICLLRFFLQVFDVVLEDEKVRFSFPGDPNERLIVILNHTYYFFSVRHFYADGRRPVDEMLEVPRFLKGLLRRARRLSTML